MFALIRFCGQGPVTISRFGYLSPLGSTVLRGQGIVALFLPLYTNKTFITESLSNCFQIAVIRRANVASIFLSVLLTQRWQMTLARRYFAHRANVFANGWFDVDPTSLVQQVQHMFKRSRYLTTREDFPRNIIINT